MTLALQDVHRTFEDGDEEVVRAVAGATMTIRRGEFVALYGPSGSGKTTLLMLCAGLEVPDRGTVTWDRQDLALMRPREHTLWLREVLGIVPQHPYVDQGMTVLESAGRKLVAGGRRRRAEGRRGLGELLEAVGLEHRLRHRVERLSGGERQRLALARALSTDPALVLADEPTGNLDQARGAEILHLLRAAAEHDHRAVLLVTHDPRAAALAHRTVTLQDGRLREPAASDAVRASL